MQRDYNQIAGKRVQRLEAISDGVFASTVQAGWPDSSLEDMDDAAIERSIAEINDAIRRSAAKKS